MGTEPKKNKHGLTEAEFLVRYDPGKFERPSVTVDALIFTVTDEDHEDHSQQKPPGKRISLLMIKRADHPCIGRWALPGGFVNMDENLDAAAARELEEETGVKNVYMEQLYTMGEVGRDPRTRTISVVYMALIPSNAVELKAGDDAAKAAWFDVDEEIIESGCGNNRQWQLARLSLQNKSMEIELTATIKFFNEPEGRVKGTLLDAGGIAFDHGKIILYGLQRLREKNESF
ncbi:MAG TPA: NUDIX domain-containing protein [Methylomusa anaerophila]|uniref:Bifunctional NMN adenylyltransferase/Nudix hydrolase n=1 Tax=Methylomusa anaerophila TaxID=1930071 RepID=A0A348AGH0_9FIRM|nr:NUDIX domain-containing protein [Methylomusa anaerophila]BBB90168.1 bifunctional NMN adenylyltransferase/Nudix hydrolase [Methylomusa anaerophila]HML88106.1 NUDIX domain-containing protein [Methylomusa anaerophila]